MAPRRKLNTPLGFALRSLRGALNTDQAGLASLLYVSARTVARWENGGRPSPEQAKQLLDVAERAAPDAHDVIARLFGFEIEDREPVAVAPSASPATPPVPAPGRPSSVAEPPASVAAPLAPPPPAAPARATRHELRAALDAVVYAASEERDLLPRHLRAFGVELLQAIDRLGLSAKEAAELLAVRDRTKTKTDDATSGSAPD
jgi:DNA-binding XRE family transcriptional regulator